MLSVADKPLMMSVVMLSVIMLSVVMRSVVMLSVIVRSVAMLTVIMLSVVVLSVQAPVKSLIAFVVGFAGTSTRPDEQTNSQRKSVSRN